MLVFLLIVTALAGLIGAQTSDELEARAVIERYEAALMAGDMSNLAAIREDTAARSDIDFVRQRAPGAIRVVSSIVTGSGVQDGVYYFDVYRELVDPSGEKVTLFSANHTRVFARRQNGVMRVWLRIHRDYWFGDQLISKDSTAERISMIKANPSIDYREAIIRSAYRFRLTGDMDNATRALAVCRSVSTETADVAFLARCELNQGLLYLLQSRNRQALGSLLESESLSIRAGDPLGQARASSALGDLYSSQGNPHMARALHEKALARIKSSNIGEIEARIILNGIYMGLAHAMIAMDDLPAATQYLNLAVALGIRTDGIPDHPVKFLVAKVEVMQGKVQSSLEKLRELEDYARKRVPIDVGILVQSLNEIAAIHLRHFNDPMVCEKLAREAALLASTAGLAFSETQSLTILGNALMAREQNSEAEKVFRQAVELTESRRALIAGGGDTATTYFVNRREPYERLVDLLVRSGKVYEAFQFSERSKARTLSDLLIRTEQDIGEVSEEGGTMPSLRQTLADRNLSLLLERQKVIPDKGTLVQLEKDVEAARVALDDHRIRLSSSKQWGGLASNIFQPVDRNRLENLFPNDCTVFIEYLVTDDCIFAFLIRRRQGTTEVSVHRLNVGRKELSKKVGAFREKIQSADLGYRQDAKDLYRLLVRDSVSHLEGIDSMIFVPDGVVWDVPFQALLSDSNRFLVEDYSVGYAPSLTILAKMKELSRERPLASGRLLAFGNPRISNRTTSTEKLRGGRLEPLPSAEREVDAVGRLFRPKDRAILKGRKASESFFKSEGHRYDLLHFATHGVLNSKNPKYSSLVLSASPNTFDDGLLEAWELMEMKLNASLAVLSACETARGHTVGEGIVGLSWAFFVAGVPRVVASQWKVESRSTSDLMTVFYKNLKTDKNPSVPKALQKSMVRQIRNGIRKHPFYWAGFIAIGG